MDYEIKVIRKNEHKTNKWSGGTTTQLYIYPEDSEYSKLNFLYRISSAKVEVEESLFTHLPGVNREIMILDGELELNHEGHHNIKLKKFDKDSFKGDWITKSYGKVTDFNLMTNKGCKGILEHLQLESNEIKDIILEGKNKYNEVVTILYIAYGKATVRLRENIELYEGDILVLNKNKELVNIRVINSSKSESNVIVSNIYL